MLGSDSRWLLAPFAAWWPMEADTPEDSNQRRLLLLRKSDNDIGFSLAHLATAGIVRERPNSAVSVEPEPMRWALVRDIFFGAWDPWITHRSYRLQRIAVIS